MFRTITINPVLNGYIVGIGCQQLAYTSREKLVADLNSYLNDPEGTEKRILKEQGINAKHTLNGIAEPPAQPAPMTATAAGQSIGRIERRAGLDNVRSEFGSSAMPDPTPERAG